MTMNDQRMTTVRGKSNRPPSARTISATFAFWTSDLRLKESSAIFSTFNTYQEEWYLLPNSSKSNRFHPPFYDSII